MGKEKEKRDFNSWYTGWTKVIQNLDLKSHKWGESMSESKVNPLSYVGEIWKALTDLGLTVRVAGSIRRMKTEPNDLDLIIVHNHNRDDDIAMQQFIQQDVEDKNKVVTWFNSQKASLLDIKKGRVQLRYLFPILKDYGLAGLQVDIYFCHENEYGAMLMFLSGSAGYNIGLRTLARKLGYTLSQWGLFDKEGKCIAQKTEEEIYQALGKAYKNPEERD